MARGGLECAQGCKIGQSLKVGHVGYELNLQEAKTYRFAGRGASFKIHIVNEEQRNCSECERLDVAGRDPDMGAPPSRC